MIYVTLCRNYMDAEYRARKCAKNHNDVKRLGKRYVSICVELQNGDQYHFVPESRYEEWKVGRRGFEEVKERAENE